MNVAFLFMIPLFGALLQCFPWKVTGRKTIFLITVVLQVLALWSALSSKLPIVIEVGLWPHYAGITWMVDGLSLLFISVTIFLFIPTGWSLLRDGRYETILLHFLTAALIGSFCTGDLFNLFVMYEAFLIASYALFFGVRQLQSAKLYMWMNIIGSAFFLFAIAFLYRSLGSVNMNVIAANFHQLQPAHQNLIYLSLSLVFFLKAGLWPLFLWMPSSYPKLPTRLLAFVGALLTKVGLFGFVRLSTLIAPMAFERFHTLFLIIAVLSIFVPLLAALGTSDLKKAFAYFGISHVGLLLFAFLMDRISGTEAFLYYFFHDAIVMAGIFFFVYDYERAGRPDGIFRKSKKATIAFLILGFSAAGLPPLSGFWGEWFILKAATPSILGISVVLLTTFIGLYLILKHWDLHFVARSKKSSKKEFKISFATSYCLVLSLLVALMGMKNSSVFVQTANSLWNSRGIQEAIQRETEITENKRDFQRGED